MYGVYGVIALLSLFAIVQNGSALRCWSCSSDIDRYCADPFNMSTYNYYRSPTDCNQQNSYIFMQNGRSVCKKVTQRVNGEYIVMRSCGWLGPYDNVGKCRQESSPSYIQVEYCGTCDYDGCNSANSLKSIFLPILIPISLALLLRK